MALAAVDRQYGSSSGTPLGGVLDAYWSITRVSPIPALVLSSDASVFVGAVSHHSR